MSDDDKNSTTNIGFQAIQDMADDALERGVLDQRKADCLVEGYKKNVESRKIVFRTKAIIIRIWQNIIEYWFRYLLISAGLSGSGAWTFRDTIEQLLTNMVK